MKIKSLIWAQNRLLLPLNLAEYWEGFTKLCYKINDCCLFNDAEDVKIQVTFTSFMINIMQRTPQSRVLVMESICKKVKTKSHTRQSNILNFEI